MPYIRSQEQTSYLKISTILSGLSKTAAALVLSCSITTPAHANPQDGTVVSGSADILESGKKLDIYQHTDKTIIDWRRFDIEIDEHTEFHQLNSSSIALNRVNSSDPSRIMGKLSANGNVIIINANGVMFGKDSKVDVNGIVATTADIGNQDFMAGNMKFNKPGSPDAKIINEGEITAKQAGLVGFVAPNVENNGIINARLGKVQLTSGDSFTLDMYGDGLMEVQVSDDVKSQIITNTGKIDADGGTIEITAAAGSQVVNSLIRVEGELNAAAVSNKNGVIKIYAEGSNAVKNNIAANKGKKSGNSVVTVSAKINASGVNSGEQGGNIAVLADKVYVKNGSVITASGDAGGGSIKIGGDFQGSGDTAASVLTIIEKDAVITADAITNGMGGRAIIWSDGDTSFRGLVTAMGGAEGGDGGFIEISGHNRLDLGGLAKTLAPKGKAGQVLLDPTDIVISNAPDDHITGGSPFEPDSPGTTSYFNMTTLNNYLLNNGNITIQTIDAGGNITWADDYYYYGDGNMGNTINLIAHNDIIFNGDITYNPDWLLYLNLTAGHDIIFNDTINVATLGIFSKDGTSTISLGDNSGTLNLDVSDLSHLNVQTLVVGNASQSGLVTMAAHNWSSFVDIVTSGDVDITGAQDFGSARFSIIANDVDIGAAVNAATLTLAPHDIAGGIGIGDGTNGTFHLTTAEANLLTASTYILGRDEQTSDTEINIDKNFSNGFFRAGSGKVKIMGDIVTTLTQIYAGDLDLSGSLTTNDLNVYANNSIALGDGLAGGFNLSSDELSRLNAPSYIFNSMIGGDIRMKAYDWGGATVSFADNSGISQRPDAGKLYIEGAQNNINNFTADFNNMDVNADVNVSGNMTIRTTASGSTLDFGQGAAFLTDTEIAHLHANQINLGNSSGPIILNAATWNAPLTVTSSLNLNIAGTLVLPDSDFSVTSTNNINITADQFFGDHNVTLTSKTINLTGELNGTGILTLKSSNFMAIGGPAVTAAYELSDAELDKIKDGWDEIRLEYTLTSGQSTFGVIRLGGYTWRDDLRLTSAATNTTSTLKSFVFDGGDTNMGGNDLTMVGRQLIDLSSDLTNGRTLTLISNGTTNANNGIRWGDTATTSGTYLRIASNDIGYIADKGWENIVLGSGVTSATVVYSSSTALNSNLTLNSGLVTTSATNIGDGDINIKTNAINILDTIDGTGILNISVLTPGTSIGIRYSSGVSLYLSDAMMNHISANWSKLEFGSKNGGYGDMIIGASNWTQDVTFSAYGDLTIAGDQDFGNHDVAFYGNRIAVNAMTDGTGDLIVAPSSPFVNVSFNNGGGNFDLTNAELSNLQSFSGWASFTFGRADSEHDINIGDDVVAFGDNTTLLNGSGNIIIDRSLPMSGVNFTVRTTNGGDIILNDLGINRFLAETTGANAGDIILTGQITSNAIGDAIILNSGGNIINNAGNALIANNGRWLAYSANATDTIGEENLNSNFNRYGCTYSANCPAGVSIPGTGNGLIYSYRPAQHVGSPSLDAQQYSISNEDGSLVVVHVPVNTTIPGVNSVAAPVSESEKKDFTRKQDDSVEIGSNRIANGLIEIAPKLAKFLAI